MAVEACDSGGVPGIFAGLDCEDGLADLLTSAGLTSAICDGLDESRITTRASVGPRTLLCLRELRWALPSLGLPFTADERAGDRRASIR